MTNKLMDVNIKIDRKTNIYLLTNLIVIIIILSKINSKYKCAKRNHDFFVKHEAKFLKYWKKLKYHMINLFWNPVFVF